MPDAILAAVINWNGWRDTLACVESMRAMQGPPFHLVICDNGSTDDSRERLAQWIEAFQPTEVLLSARWLATGANLGYAGAINRCIDWGRAEIAPTHWWFLNNDVCIEPDALRHLMDAVHARPAIGLCGSVLLDWEPPHAVQAVGGIFQSVIATGRHLKMLPRDAGVFDGIDYPVGASLLATRDFIDRVGPMDDGYFLYYEEVDWAERGRRAGFRPAVALGSRLRHKEGASTGSMGGVRAKSLLSEHYGVRNRLRYTRKFSPALLPLVWLSLWAVLADRLLHREWRRAETVLRLMFDPRAERPRRRQ
jgi:GT2 family glycosyltransferase